MPLQSHDWNASHILLCGLGREPSPSPSPVLSPVSSGGCDGACWFQHFPVCLLGRPLLPWEWSNAGDPPWLLGLTLSLKTSLKSSEPPVVVFKMPALCESSHLGCCEGQELVFFRLLKQLLLFFCSQDHGF